MTNFEDDIGLAYAYLPHWWDKNRRANCFSLAGVLQIMKLLGEFKLNIDLIKCLTLTRSLKFSFITSSRQCDDFRNE